MAKQDRDVYMKDAPKSPAVDTSKHNDGGILSNLYDMAKGIISSVGTDPVKTAQKAAQGNRSAVIDQNVASQGG